jgi:hypothetical protein
MFELLNTTVPYSYNVLHGNKNDRVLASFSTSAKSKMRPCPKCEMFTFYFRFFQFYGKHDYADRWIMAAFTGARTVFDSSAADFKAFSLEARSGMC